MKRRCAGARLKPACKEVGLDLRTIQRWRRRDVGDDLRHGPRRTPANKLSEVERRLLEVANSEELRNKSPKQIVPTVADRGTYAGSESTFSRLFATMIDAGLPLVQCLAGVDIVLMGLPHQDSVELVRALLDQDTRVIDMPDAFRIKRISAYERFYGSKHPRPDLLEPARASCRWASCRSRLRWCAGSSRCPSYVFRPSCPGRRRTGDPEHEPDARAGRDRVTTRPRSLSVAGPEKPGRP